MNTCDGSPPHVLECYGRVELPCPRCGQPVQQFRLDCCGESPLAPLECNPCRLLCQDCPSEVRGGPQRWRVVHAETCPWLRRQRAGEVVGTIPCGSTVTHRGPYERRPAA